MSTAKIANRYAVALLDLSKGQDAKRDSLSESLLELSKLYDNKEVRKVLSSPVVGKDVLKAVFDYALSKLTPDKSLTDLVRLLIENRRTAIIPEIAKTFYKKLQEERGVVDATVETAVNLGSAELSEVQAKLEKMLGKKVKISTRLNPSLLGGFVIRIENNLLDMSLKTKLDHMIKTAVS